MAWWQWYLVLSLGVSLVWTTFEAIRFYRMEPRPEKVDYDIEDAIEAGHIQREVFGDRTVLHPVDDEGRLLLEATDFTNHLQQKRKGLYFIIAVLYVTVVWPYELYTELKYRFFTADE